MGRVIWACQDSNVIGSIRGCISKCRGMYHSASPTFVKEHTHVEDIAVHRVRGARVQPLAQDRDIIVYVASIY